MMKTSRFARRTKWQLLALLTLLDDLSPLNYFNISLKSIYMLACETYRQVCLVLFCILNKFVKIGIS